MGCALLLNNWQRERRGSYRSKESGLPRAEYTVCGRLSPDMSRVSFLSACVTPKPTPPQTIQHLPPAWICIWVFALTVFWTSYTQERFAERSCFFFQQCSASNLNSCTHSHLGATPPSSAGVVPGVDQEQRSSTWNMAFDNLSFIIFKWMLFIMK